MKKIAHAIAVAGVAVTSFSVLNAAAQATSPHTLATKVSLFSEYEYRGISQTSEKPAVQLNVDYSHSSGFYAGTFISNINWLKDYKDIGLVEKSAAVEVDLFGGYKFEVVKDVTLDVGFLHYNYPGAKAVSGAPNPNTNEVYIGAAYGPFSAKYSYSLGGTFGVPISKGTTFIELNFSKEILPKLTLNAQIAKQAFKGNNQGFDNDAELTYVVYKVGPSYDLGSGWTVGGYFKDTDAKAASYTVKGKEWSKGRLVAFVSKNF